MPAAEPANPHPALTTPPAATSRASWPRRLVSAVGIVGIPTYTRLVRATVLQQRELDYVHAARARWAPRRCASSRAAI